MIDEKKVLAIIPARGGSKGIKNKNIIDICGKPLIAYTIEAGKNSKYIDRVIVSTDSKIIGDVAAQCGADVPFYRPDYLSGDKAKSIDAVVHAVQTLKLQNEDYDIIVFLQPTSPLRDENDIDNALETFIKGGSKGLASVSEVVDHPLLIRTIDEDNSLEPLLKGVGSSVRRQDFPAFYRINGAIYINDISEIDSNLSMNDNPKGYVMERSHSVDIDDMDDVERVKQILSKR